MNAPTSAHGNFPDALDALNKGDISKAVAELEHLVGDGDGKAAFYLGRIHELGLTGQKDEQRALRFYQIGAQLGAPEALNRMGLAFLSGWQVPQDAQSAATLFCRAADQGDVNAMFNCASLRLSGSGTPQDEVAAYILFGKAHDAGHRSYARKLVTA